MFYKMITKKRDEWLRGENSVKDLIAYIERTGQMRDAQIDAIKTYLFLKIACENQPLVKLFSAGKFNSLDLDDLEISTSTRDALKNSPALAALYEFASQKDDDGNQLSASICEAIKKEPTSVDAVEFFKEAFYHVTYTDYLFSLPMGAGKTYLMAAFIYLDLYFACNEPDNQVFAHNCIIIAPSGLKSSVVPSLRTIQNFDPSWIIPEPAASNLKQMLIFEVLDESKTAKKSNKTRNPNVQKIAIHQPLEKLFGLVAVTNAEKVILNGIVESKGQISMFEESEDEKDRQANELRNLIGKLPNLSVFIDEVHHAATDEKKLRSVVSKWARHGSVNSVIGFSGTPYLQGTEKVKATGKIAIAMKEIANIVYYYPLVNGIGNFLKKPVVYISDSNKRLEIIENGVREFLRQYKDTTYPDGTCAKLGIYCGSIKTLEEQVYPLVEKIVSEYGLDPVSVVLKYHGGNKEYSIPVDSELEFQALDKPFSTKKIILLVQIGKEGWDCKSLTGIILSQEGDCATNMVLQTSCRCLRQVQKDEIETALIYLNKSNAETLNLQLEQQHKISLREFQSGVKAHTTTLKRYERMRHLRLPKVDFYQLKVIYHAVNVEPPTDIAAKILAAPDAVRRDALIQQAEMSTSLSITNSGSLDKAERGNIVANFELWVNEIAKESFGFLSRAKLLEYRDTLEKAFSAMTYERDGVRYFSSHYDLPEANAMIRKAFYERRSFETTEELVPEEASLLHIENFTPEVQTMKPDDYYPNQEIVEKIIKDDNGKLKLTKNQADDIKMLEARGYHDFADSIRQQIISHPMKDASFHYLPYHTDSEFEQIYLEELLRSACIKEKNLEVYYNGDRALTEFKIKCYKKDGKAWRYLGMYTPDFLVIQRKYGAIHKALIAETKGEGFAADFEDKRKFMETYFTDANNKKYGYPRFDFLYVEDTLEQSERIKKTIKKIEEFFTQE